MKSDFPLKPAAWLLGSLLLLAGLPVRGQAPAALSFAASTNGAFTFDTGVLRGTLRANGKSVGLQSVTHRPTGQRLDSSMGLLSHYRVFTTGQRYGAGAWDWPSTAQLTADGAVEVLWPATPERPFELRAAYRWVTPTAIEATTSVTAQRDLAKFESFLAGYFAPAFTNALAAAGTDYLAAGRADGEWQMFPRDAAAIRVIQDGRWKLEPHPVDWTIRPAFRQPIAVRSAPAHRLSVLVMAQREEAFTLAMPYETEGHFSLYVSQFGRDLRAGETAHSRLRLAVIESTLPRDFDAAWTDFAQRSAETPAGGR